MSIGNIFWSFFPGAFWMLQVHIYEPFSFVSISNEKAAQSVATEQAAAYQVL